MHRFAPHHRTFFLSLCALFTVGVIAFVVSKASADEPVPWLSSDWEYRNLISIDADHIDATLTDFPILVSTTSTALRDNAQSGANDIVFTAGDGIDDIELTLRGIADGKADIRFRGLNNREEMVSPTPTTPITVEDGEAKQGSFWLWALVAALSGGGTGLAIFIAAKRRRTTKP